MAFSVTNIGHDQWTLIGNNVSAFTFQNVGQNALYIDSSSNANTAPTANVGLVYPTWNGEVQVAIADLTPSGGAYIWARSVTQTTNVLVDA